MAAAARAFVLAGVWSMQFLCLSAFLNIEELNEMKYGIEILSDPIIKGQTQSDDVVVVSSKYKQMYECRLPAQALKFQQEAEDETQSYSGLGISELLKPMHAAPCLVKTKDWWTYEFCYGQHIKQYHTEDSEVKGDVMYLGFYESEFDWNNETAKASKQHKLKRYHSQTYVNGSKCDLNEKPREAEVRFMCEEGSGDYIARVDEPQSCNYVLTVHTTRICHHPYLRPAVVSKPQPIRCQPALSPEQYVEYVKAQVTDTKRKVEKISEELKTLDEMLLKDQNAQTDEEKDLTLESENQTEELSDTGENVLELEGIETLNSQEVTEDEDNGEKFWDRISKPVSEEGPLSEEKLEEADSKLSDAFKTGDDNLQGDQGKQEVQFRITRNPEDLLKLIRELKDQTAKRKGDEDKDPTVDTSARSSDESTDQDFSAKQEEMIDSEENELIKDFEKELEDVSLPKSKMSEIKREVKEEMEKEFENLIDEAQDELEAEGLKGEFDRNQASKTLATTLNKLIDKLEEKEVAHGEKDSDTSKGSPSPASKQTDETDEDTEGHVKVRVTKINPGSPLHKEMKVREMSGTDPQLRQIQNVVKEQLEKAGLKAEGKIEVKIVTTRSLGDDDDMHWLSEEDTKSFRELLINLLTGGTEEVYKEQQRQQQLEDNYRFVWGESQEEAQSSSSTDSDDMDF
ncbi:protein OS-9 isoform X1 [Hemiscyllium ocellatum]|uniref:protein OS-9 isoform X1 n=1 Tax=Hemiscyllium ocellatum TaxID=170820 RepID=UPI002965D143|nr:protein OS-9 isoform X1 [Hemiscyllium ocellatum]